MPKITWQFAATAVVVLFVVMIWVAVEKVGAHGFFQMIIDPINTGLKTSFPNPF